jgi:hypothetical protein
MCCVVQMNRAEDFVAGPLRGPLKRREVRNDDKKCLILSRKGEPVGSMKEVFKKDLNAFVKQLNPCYNWDNQADDDRDSIWERMDTQYEYMGGREKLCKKFFRGEISKAISRYSPILLSNILNRSFPIPYLHYHVILHVRYLVM